MENRYGQPLEPFVQYMRFCIVKLPIASKSRTVIHCKHRYYQRIRHASLWIAGALFASGVYAQESYVTDAGIPSPRAYQSSSLWPLCTLDPLANNITEDTGAGDDTETRFRADSAESTKTEALLLGNVEVRRGDRRLQASQMRLDRSDNRVEAEGDVIFGDPMLALRGKGAELYLDENKGSFSEADYYLLERNAQGSARRIEHNARKKKTRLREVTYSTCARGRETWQLRSERLDLNHKTQRGEARNATVVYKGVPVLYSPYLSFPISDERHSGFLLPRIGLVSSNGFDLTVPYYWNWAPNRDVTFFPRYMSDRGFLLGAEFRFLQERHEGEIAGEYLPNDRQGEGSRGSINVNHRARPFHRLFTDFLYEYVSDDDYIDDINTNIDLLSPNYLERHLNAKYVQRNWRLLAQIQDFQTLERDVFNPRNQPYDRLPRLLLNGNWATGFYNTEFGLRTEGVNFNHDDKTTGGRFDIRPTLGLPLRWPAGFLIPRVSYQYTAYDLDDMEPGIDSAPTRGLPTFSMDGSLIFERPIQWRWGNFAGMQTLEPRLFYLYVPREDQDDIPDFDTTLVDPSYGWLFRENRFTGADRVGDANQLTTALTTRAIDGESGIERLRINVGQIQYFQKRKVTLPSLPRNSDSTSSLITEGVLRASSAIFMRAGVHFATDDMEFRRTNLDLNYNADNRNKLFNVSYRFAENDPAFPQRQELNQLDLSMLWPINDRWRSMARWNYSIKESRSLDIFGGFEYRQCCWAFRLVLRSNRPNPEDDPKNSVFAEFDFRGLASVGTGVTKLMEDYIRGYQRPD